MKRSAFTLVELLVVIAVVGILAGLMVPLVQGMHKRALTTDAKDLCIQVADAWNLLPVDYGRFPLKDIIKEQAGRGIENASGATSWEHKGDLVFAMSPGAGNVLNFWTPKNPLPLTDKKAFPQNLSDSRVKWTGSDPPDQAEIDRWKPDTRFERSSSQKRFGVFAMGSRSDESDGDGVVHPDSKDWLVGGSPTAGDDEEGEEEVRRRAIAWCKVSRADGQLVYSWK